MDCKLDRIAQIQDMPRAELKRYYAQANIGTVRYVVNFHDGVKTHADGSEFYDIRTFSNKRDRNAFIAELHHAGYVVR